VPGSSLHKICVVTDCGLDGRGLIPSLGKDYRPRCHVQLALRHIQWVQEAVSAGAMIRFFLFTTASRPSLGPTQPHVQWVPGALSLGVKRPGHEADRSPPSSDEAKNAWSYTPPLPQYVFMRWCLIKHRDALRTPSYRLGESWCSNHGSRRHSYWHCQRFCLL
jgi:hypothetical protein